MTFTRDQKNHVLKQLKAHIRDSATRTLVLDEDTHVSLELLIEQGVFGSDIMSSAVYLSRFLYQHPELYSGKDAADIGCGPGTQGIVMSTYGAASVICSDVNLKAVLNTQKNIEGLKLTNAEVCQSDLFESLPKQRTYDVIVFNHPFFSGEPEQCEEDPNQDVMLRRSMLGGTALLQRFFREAPEYLRQNGTIIMPYFHFAGIENDPATHVKKYHLNIFQEHKIESKQGFQLGAVSIYLISRENKGLK